MNIQWFPGHMKKTLQNINNYLKFIDIVLVILDARIPISSFNPELLKSLNNKPTLILLNKISLTDQNKNNLFLNFFQKKKLKILFIDAKYKINTKKIFPVIEKILKKKNTKYNPNLLKLMIVGIPNVGKSTLINCLTQKKITITANQPGSTKKLQWINLKENIKLLDTPGILYPKINNPKIGYVLGLCGCIKEKLISKEKLVDYALSYLKKYYFQKIKKHFNLNIEEIEKENLLKIILSKMYLNEINKEKIINNIFYQIKNAKIKEINFDLDFVI
jgi:ribosome biogenesis GTPase A